MSTSGATTMHQPMDKKKGSLGNLKKRNALDPLPSDRKILDTLYSHYGKPENIAKEKLKLYTAYTSPAGYPQDSWIDDGYQMGRVTVFTKYNKSGNEMIQETRIGEEGKGTWFIGVSSKKIKVWIGGKLDVILDVEV